MNIPGAALIDLIKKGIKHPHRIPWFLRRLVKHKIPHEVNKLYFRKAGFWDYNRNGINIFGADWDNLIVLDACRSDMSPGFSSLPGESKVVCSRASNTTEWLRANFNDRELLDVVYVTANPMHLHRSQEFDFDFTFHDVVNVWEDGEWDEEYNTVLPETTIKYAKRAAEEYPNKRLLIHLIQPHYPFLSSQLEADKVGADPETPTFWARIQHGELDVEQSDVWAAYNESLKKTLPYIEDLLHSLRGKSVVTADHGNMIGERGQPVPIRYWGHPAGIYTDQLVRVPWIKHCNGERKQISAEPSYKQQDVGDEKVNERLRDLGYKI